jgi:DNA-binding response OmpR family regulator
LIVLDLMLPDMPGEEVCRRLRLESRVPIIMLTAKVEDADAVRGLTLGADDYVTKPFSPRQLMARVAAVLRRTQGHGAAVSAPLSFDGGGLVVDLDARVARASGVDAGLTPREFAILALLVSSPGRSFTRQELVLRALGEDFEGFDRTVDAHVKNLRQKIEPDPRSPRYVVTVHGVGYRFQPPEAP